MGRRGGGGRGRGRPYSSSSALVVFDCHMTQRHILPTVIKYDGCFVDTTDGAMNRNTGVFTVAVPGIYQVGFSPKSTCTSFSHSRRFRFLNYNCNCLGKCHTAGQDRPHVFIKEILTTILFL